MNEFQSYRVRVIRIAHRAGNSLADLRAALDAGVDLVEADVRLYRGVLEMRHAKALGRQLLWEPWRDIARRRDVPVPLLAEILTTAAGDSRLMLDLKGPWRAVAPRTAAVLREVAPDVPVTVCTRDWGMLKAFQDQPHIRRVYSAGSRRQLDQVRLLVQRRRVDGLSIRLSLLTPAVVAELHRHTDLIMAWSVDTDADLAQARAVGVSGIISKNLPLLRSVTPAV